ncbi:MAG TPA: hypothetical protein VNK96_02960 [Fimbriimonadales bacterium]|nr:hypothetical protein [Fimbriimonadales bacterium]
MEQSANWKKSYLEVFREAFLVRDIDEGGWVLDPGESFPETLNAISAEEASKRVKDCNSIAAHVDHLRFALNRANRYARDEEPTESWEVSWQNQTIDEGNWEILKNDLRREYEEFGKFVEENDNWSNEALLTGTIAQLSHIYYHLASIRQLMKVVK